jgi:hypothetical protein
MTQVHLSRVDDIVELTRWYSEPPEGVRANMIVSLDGAATFDGRAGPLSDFLDQQPLLALRGYADGLLIRAGTVPAENYGRARARLRSDPVSRGACALLAAVSALVGPRDVEVRA